VDTRELSERLRRHYIKPGQPLPGGVFLTEVQSPRSSYGAGGRRIDALYIGFTSSRGHMIEGHELKVSRSDWLHELDQAHKAEEWWSHCHKWWVVASDSSIVKPEELPEGWGLMVPNPRTKTRMDVIVKASVKEPIVTFELLLEIAKKLDTMRSEAVHKARVEIREEALVDARHKASTEQEQETRRNAKAARELRELQDLTGLDLTGAWYTSGAEYVSRKEAATLLRQWCQGEAKRRRLIKHSQSALVAIARQAKSLLTLAESGPKPNPYNEEDDIDTP